MKEMKDRGVPDEEQLNEYEKANGKAHVPTVRDLRFEVRGDVVQAVVDYLATRPWGEVNGLMVELSRLPKIEG